MKVQTIKMTRTEALETVADILVKNKDCQFSSACDIAREIVKELGFKE